MAARELGPHIAILRYLRYVLPHGWKVHHSPNQGHGRNARQGAILKAMGVIAGWPDLQIVGPAELSPSVFFVETKAAKGSRSEAQRDLHDELLDLGYRVGVARSIDEMRALARQWGLPIREGLVPVANSPSSVARSIKTPRIAPVTRKTRAVGKRGVTPRNATKRQATEMKHD